LCSRVDVAGAGFFSLFSWGRLGGSSHAGPGVAIVPGRSPGLPLLSFRQTPRHVSRHVAGPRGLKRGALRPVRVRRTAAWRRRKRNAAFPTSLKVRRRSGRRRRGPNCSAAVAPPRPRARAREQHAGAKLPCFMRGTIPRLQHRAVVAPPLPWALPASHVHRCWSREASRMSAIGGGTCFSTWPLPRRISCPLGILCTFAAVPCRFVCPVVPGGTKSTGTETQSQPPGISRGV